MRKKSRALCEQNFQQHFIGKKFNSSSRKIIEDHFVNKKCQKHIFKNSIGICEEIIEHHGQAKTS
jgi:hypothetical protein